MFPGPGPEYLSLLNQSGKFTPHRFIIHSDLSMIIFVVKFVTSPAPAFALVSSFRFASSLVIGYMVDGVNPAGDF